MGIRGQPQASPTSRRKPRIEIKGHPDFAEHLKRLRSSNHGEDKQLVTLIDGAIELLLENPSAGEKIPRDRWPAKYGDLGLPCLFRYELGHRHRITYSLIRKDDILYVWILDALDHTEYNRLFGYD